MQWWIKSDFFVEYKTIYMFDYAIFTGYLTCGVQISTLWRIWWRHYSVIDKVLWLYLKTCELYEQRHLWNNTLNKGNFLILSIYHSLIYKVFLTISESMWTICDPAWLNEALWGEYQNREKYFISIKHYFLHILMQKLLLCDIPIKSYEMLSIAIYDIIQNNFTEVWAVKDCNL